MLRKFSGCPGSHTDNVILNGIFQNEELTFTAHPQKPTPPQTHLAGFSSPSFLLIRTAGSETHSNSPTSLYESRSYFFLVWSNFQGEPHNFPPNVNLLKNK